MDPKEATMNKAFNSRARQLFGNDVGDMLDNHNLFAGRYMDDMSGTPSASSIIGKPPEEQQRIVDEASEKVELYNIFCKKFISHPANRDESLYDNYKG